MIPTSLCGSSLPIVGLGGHPTNPHQRLDTQVVQLQSVHCMWEETRLTTRMMSSFLLVGRLPSRPEKKVVEPSPHSPPLRMLPWPLLLQRILLRSLPLLPILAQRNAKGIRATDPTLTPRVPKSMKTVVRPTARLLVFPTRPRCPQ